VLKDRFMRIAAEGRGFVRLRLYRELISDIKGRIVPVGPNRKVARKEYPKEPHPPHNHKSNC
ncbi:MAG: hypothetical protein LBF74_05265, partial [Treponema sp.]|nr:hypothetical protein [Treponema sp.]